MLNPETMQEAKKSLKEKGIKAEEVKNLPPIEALCEPTTHPPMVEVHSLLDFNASDVPHSKPPDQCLDEIDNFIIKQTHFNTQVQNQLQEIFYVIKNLHDVIERTANDVKGLTKNFTMVQTQVEQITKVQKDLLAETFKKDDKHAFGIATRGGA